MQITIDKKTGVLGSIILILVAVILVMGFSSDESGHNGMNHNEMLDSEKDDALGGLTGADIMFLQMMIPHHQQAIDISNLALSKSKDGELIALATAVRDGQADEIIQMQQWLSDAGASTAMGHSMSDSMGGMLDEAELAALTASSGKDFDLLWLKAMTGHHEGAIHMTQMIKDATNTTIKKFGQDIVTLQSAQVEQMSKMLKRIS